MSIQAVGWALEQELPARPKLVLVAICNHANHVDGYCWLKAETIAKEASCTPRSIFNFVGALIRNGFIRKALRKGEDGKQRATDYWVLFEREEKRWESPANAEAPEGEDEAEEKASSEDEPLDVVLPDERGACGENAEPPGPQPVDKHAGACGPPESTFIRYNAEPSKINPKERSARASGAVAGAMRSYKPPPPQPVGEVFNNAKEVFVFERTPAYEAWCKVKAKQRGLSSWKLTTRKLVDGQWRSGWYFPSLFPPESKSTGPPDLSDEDAKALTGS